MKDKAIARLAEEVRGLMWNPDARRIFNEAGVHLTRATFYSSIPSLDEIERSFEYTGDGRPYLDTEVFDAEAMRGFLAELQPFADEFEAPQTGDLKNPDGFFWKNPAFSFSDALSYWSILRMTEPEVVLEVGSGFSTLVARAALERNGSGRLVCVEPYPKPWLAKTGAEVIDRPVQDLPLDFFEDLLPSGSVFFIDSTHTVKSGSDCLHLYLRILPKLRRQMYLHAHDIFLPAGYPKDWLTAQDIHWTEQYLLLALLEGNPDFRVLFGSNYHRLENPELLDRFMGGKAPGGGGSLWFERVAPK
jgi:hypothetical protein